jgi:hypothetical protein
LWISENGIEINALISEIIDSRITSFAWLDVFLSAVVLIGFVNYEGSRLKMGKLWVPILGTCAVGVSFGLPLFLLLREVQLTKVPNS